MNLIIIGNGFDIAQKNNIKNYNYEFAKSITNSDEYFNNILKVAYDFDTSYVNFGKYLKHHSKEVYDFLKVISSSDIEKEEYWYQFEERLGDHDFDKVTTEMISESNVIGKFLPLSRNEAIKFYKDIAEENLKKLKVMFCRWINQKNNYLIDFVENNRVSGLNIMNNFSERDMFLSFNYTSTLEYVYNIPLVYHIHGDLLEHEGQVNQNNKLNKIILGHKRNAFIDNKKYTDNKIANDNVLDIERKYCEIFVKDCDKIIEDDSTNFFKVLTENKDLISDVYVLGHSIEEVDISYFKKIIKILGCKPKWHISDYNNDFYCKEKRLREISNDLDITKCIIE